MVNDLWYLLRQNRGAVFGLVLIGVLVLIAVFAPWLAPHDPTEIFTSHLNMPPIWGDGGTVSFLFGTDDVGRDMLSRLIYGARVSLGVGLSVAVFSVVVGAFLGLVSGYVGGTLDYILMRLMDTVMALPSILLSIVVVSILGPSLINAVLAVGIVGVPNVVRLVRASVINEKEKTYITATRSFGASHSRILFLHIFPNTLAPLIVQGTLSFSDGILNVAALGFLGMGAQPPTPEWGTMLADSRAFIESAPSLVFLPGVCILLAVFGFNLLGDGLRDAFDPKLKGRE